MSEIFGIPLLTAEHIVAVSSPEIPVSESVICGIYFLIRGKEVVYVGQSINAQSRAMQHKHDKEFEKVYFLRVPQKHMDLIESIYIHELRPRLNGLAIYHDKRGRLRAPLSVFRISAALFGAGQSRAQAHNPETPA